ncbi:MAG: DUF1566 domain-containing protein [Chitinophagaceae bacterium]
MGHISITNQGRKDTVIIKKRGFLYVDEHNTKYLHPYLFEEINYNVSIIFDTQNHIGTYSMNITDLHALTTYYIRAFAILEYKMEDGGKETKLVLSHNIVNHTMPINPIMQVSTVSVLDIKETSAMLNAKIISAGVPAYTERGFVYDTIPNVTSINKIMVTGGGADTGNYNTQITGLSDNTTYYFKAYLSNGDTTVYGKELSFRTPLAIFVVVDDIAIKKGDEKDGVKRWNDAVEQCKTSRTGGYDDWRLPTKEELNIMYNKKHIIGNFSPVSYWSGTEDGSTRAWAHYFPNGSQNSTPKTIGYYIRCIRNIN